MQALTMTAEQTELYDTSILTEDCHRVWGDIRRSAQRLANETGETVEIYTADGNVVHAVYPTE